MSVILITQYGTFFFLLGMSVVGLLGKPCEYMLLHSELFMDEVQSTICFTPLECPQSDKASQLFETTVL